MKTIILTGGGTAGHVVPALALLPELRKHFENIHFFGGSGIEKELCKSENVPFHELPVVKFDRSHLLNNAKIPFVLTKGIAEAKRLLRLLDADVVFSKGGYASLPACFAAKQLGIPVIAHESDYTLGLANRLVSKFAAETITSFPETDGGTFVGNPVRKEIYSGDKCRALKKYPVDPRKKTLLVFGGSLGAEAINEVIYKGLDKFTEKYNVIHISGKSGDLTKKHKDYYQLTFTHDMPDLYALCDTAVCRGGANTLSELACLGKKSVIIPLPKGNSRGDQLDNAMSYKKKGFVEVLPQNELFVETLMQKIEEIQNKNVPKYDAKDVEKNIVDIIVNAAIKCRKTA